MNKIIVIVSIVVFAVLSLVTGIFLFTSANGKFNTSLKEVTDREANIQEQINQVKADKDQNNYLPNDVVQYFISSLRDNSEDNAKLYATKDAQDKNQLSWLDVKKEDLYIKDITYTVNESVASVKVTFAGNEQEIIKNFSLKKENSVWKIVDIKGE